MSTPLSPARPLRPQPGNASAPKIAFLLPTSTFDLIYGREVLAEVAAHGVVMNNEFIDHPAHLRSAPPAWLGETEIVFTGWGSPQFDAPLLALMPKLRAVFHGGGTTRPYLSADFWSRGISLSTAAAANAIPVAEFTTAAIVLSLKQAWQLSRQVSLERTFPARLPIVPGALGSTVGLISLGLIGRLVAERLRALEVRVLGHDPFLSAADFEHCRAEPATLPDLMRRSDVVSLHTSLRKDTEGFITRELLDLLKPGATLINTARGGLVRTPDLVAFLRDRPDVQAILDVTQPEPPEANSALYDLPNVFLTPHIAGSLGSECRRMGRAMVGEFHRYLQGLPLLHGLSRDQAERQT